MTTPNARRNPYIIGKPIEEVANLFGREDLFNFIDSSLKEYFKQENKPQNQTQSLKVILLPGQRRIGKSSVLQNLEKKLADNNLVFVPFDLQEHSQSSVSKIFYHLAEEIIKSLDLDPDRIIAPTNEALNTNSDIFYREFLPKIYGEIENKNLVLLIDEFDVVDNDNFHEILKQTLRYNAKLCIIAVVGKNMTIAENVNYFFKDSRRRKIALLDDSIAEKLITQQESSPLNFEPDAITKIRQLTAGHPYFIQVICFTLFVQAKVNDNWNITSQNVENNIDKAIAYADGHLSDFWKNWCILERVVMSTVAEAQKRASELNQVEPKEPLNLLKEYGIIETETDELKNASQRLEDNDYLVDAKRKIKVELIRSWLLNNHRFHQEIREMAKFKEEEVNPICEEANSLYQQGKKQEAITRYEDALKINPNNFNTVCALAHAYLEVENFERAIELYTRADQFDKTLNREKLVDALQKSAYDFSIQGQLSQAKVQFDKIESKLEIESENELVKNKIRKIKRAIEQQDKRREAEQEKLRQLEAQMVKIQKLSDRWRVLVSTIAAAGILAVGIGVNRWSTPCPAGQLKVNSFSCVPDSFDISRGEDKLFPDSSNSNLDQGPDSSKSNLDQGIEAFKKGNYSQAAEFFQKAVKDQPNNPEALIYYNNARARQQGKPLTLAVAVPVDNFETVAEEMLRGVAQAQNQFNDNNVLNDQLLEIAIANDANKPNKAKSIAQELVKDPSILGVIGHYTSDASKAALPEYTKAGLSIVSPTSTSTSKSLKSDVFFRTVPSDSAAGKKLAEYAKRSGLNSVVIFYNHQSTYSKSLTREFTNNFGGLSKKIDLSKPNLNIEQAVQESAQEVQAAMLFPAGETIYLEKALEIAKANTKLGVQRLKLLTASAMYNPNTLNNDQNAIEGLILAVPWFSQAPNAKTFIKAASNQWGTGMVSWRTATSYDATQALIQALSPNASRSTVLKALPNVNLPASATSGDALQFQNGERQTQPILVKVENSEFKLLQ
ncbi:MAG: ABC transporter substrate-binding protein [Gloeotrichia echinulata GP01]